MSNTLTQDEAERLLKMVKKSLVQFIDFPQKGINEEFEVIGDTKHDLFIINIYHARVNIKKYNFNARIKKNGIILLQLHINRFGKHYNSPTEETICGSHWHVYIEGYENTIAYPIEINEDNFIENTIEFFKKFNIIEPPRISYQDQMGLN